MILSEDLELVAREDGLDVHNVMREEVKNRTDCAIQSTYLNFHLNSGRFYGNL